MPQTTLNPPVLRSECVKKDYRQQEHVGDLDKVNASEDFFVMLCEAHGRNI
jgi:hypothetical protein